MIIRDLGNTTLNGKLTKARPYYEVQCPVCSKLRYVRKDAITETHTCRSCVKKQVNAANATQILNAGTKYCTACKLQLPLSAFNKHSGFLTGYRSQCRKCEDSLTADARANHRARPENKEKKRKYDKQYTAQPHRRERANSLAKSWTAKNPEKRKAITQNDRHKRRSHTAHTSITGPAMVIWLSEQLKVCSYCGSTCTDTYTVDHIEPLSKGGVHEFTNLTIACPSCNSSKNNKQLLVWLAIRQLYNIQ